MSITIDIDTGGTFTDGFVTSDGDVFSVKVDTTPHDLTEGFISCLEAAAERLNLSFKSLMKHTDVIRYSTTFGTNSIIQRNGPRLGVIVTAGNEQRLYGDAARSGCFDWLLSSEDMVKGLPVSVTEDGTVAGTVDEAEVRRVLIELLEGGARSLVVAIEGSHSDDSVERAIRNVVRSEFPRHFLGSLPTLMSSEISKSRDNELRLQTALVSAYIHHGLARHLYTAEEEIRRRGYVRPLLVVHANGAVSRVAKSIAAYTYNSGPAAGLVGSNELGQRLEVVDGLTLDIGGTSTDIGVVGAAWAAPEESVTIDGVRVDVQSMVAESIGGGGGSVARVDEGVVRVGPQSAGAFPGPMCYGLGGDQPTVTDANLVLGYLDPDTFLGGRRVLDAAKARSGIEAKIAAPLGIPVEQAAWLIRQKIDEVIAEGLASYSGSKGIEAHVLFAYGGGGALHVASVADRLGIPLAYCFPMGPVFSAYGSSRMDVSHLYEETAPHRSVMPGTVVVDLVDAMKAEAARDMLGEGFDPGQVNYEFEAGFATVGDRSGKVYVPIDDITDIALDVLTAAATAEISARSPSDGAEPGLSWETVRLRATAATPHPTLLDESQVPGVTEPAATTTRPAWTGSEMADIAVFSINDLTPGDEIQGPAVIDGELTTILVTAARRARVDGAGNVILETSGSGDD